MEKVIVEVRDDHFIELTPGEYNMDFSIKERIIDNGKDSEEIKITGFLKWDGCMNWKTNPEHMYHFCEPDHADLLNECFYNIYEAGQKYIEKWMDN